MPAEENTSTKFGWSYQPEISGNFSNHVDCNLVTKIAMATGKSNGNLVTKMTTATVGTLITVIIIVMSFMYLGLHVRCMLFLSDLTKLIFLYRFLVILPSLISHENLFSGSWVVPCRWMDRQAWWYSTVAFCSLVHALRNKMCICYGSENSVCGR
jgi:hypothetical protein